MEENETGTIELDGSDDEVEESLIKLMKRNATKNVLQPHMADPTVLEQLKKSK